MKRFDAAATAIAWACLLVSALAFLTGVAFADDYTDTTALFRHADASAALFKSSCGYAVFPTIGKGGLMYEAAVAGQKFSYDARR